MLQGMIFWRNWQTDYWVFYWFCDSAPFLFSVLFFLGKYQMIKGLIHIGLLGQLLYIISFISAAFTGVPLFGFSVDFTIGIVNITITFLMHLSTPLATVATRRIVPNAQSLLASGIFLLGFYCIVLLFTNPESAMDWNFNYIYSTGFTATIPYYTQLWIPIAFFFVALPTYIIERYTPQSIRSLSSFATTRFHHPIHRHAA